jgi:hypothetical protein
MLLAQKGHLFAYLFFFTAYQVLILNIAYIGAQFILNIGIDVSLGAHPEAQN